MATLSLSAEWHCALSKPPIQHSDWMLGSVTDAALLLLLLLLVSFSPQGLFHFPAESWSNVPFVVCVIKSLLQWLACNLFHRQMKLALVSVCCVYCTLDVCGLSLFALVSPSGRGVRVVWLPYLLCPALVSALTSPVLHQAPLCSSSPQIER